MLHKGEWFMALLDTLFGVQDYKNVNFKCIQWYKGLNIAFLFYGVKFEFFLLEIIINSLNAGKWLVLDFKIKK